MPQHAPGPYWSQTYEFGTVLHDLANRRIAEVFHDADNPTRSAATTRLFKLAPTMLLDLKMVVSILDQANEHPELQLYLHRTIAAAEHEPEKARRLMLLVNAVDAPLWSAAEMPI
jgi:hypothetical protein